MATGFLKRGLTGCLWLTLALAAAGCDSPQPSQAKAPGGSGGERPAVSVSQPLKRQIVEWDEYTGRFDAVAMVEVRARVSGHLTEVHFKDGQDVKPGDLLYEIRSEEHTSELQSLRHLVCRLLLE